MIILEIVPPEAHRAHEDAEWAALPPHTVTRFPARSPSQSGVVQVRSSRFFHSCELRNTSSSGLKTEKMLREATRIIFRFARLSATVSRHGSSRNSLDASHPPRSLRPFARRTRPSMQPLFRRPSPEMS